MKRIFFVFIIFQSAITIGFGQNLDSLYSVWEDPAQSDSIRVKAYYDYIWKGYLFSRPDTAELMAQALQTYSNKQGYPKASGAGYHLQGLANTLQSNNTRSLEFYQKALSIREEIRDKQGIASTLNNLGTFYKNQGNYPRALEYHQKSMAINEELGDKSRLANSLISISNIFGYHGDYPRALEYVQKSLSINEELGNKKAIAGNLNNIGIIYQDQGNYTSAFKYFQKSMSINEELGDKKGIATNLNNIGIIYQNQGNFPRALEYYKNSIPIHEDIGDKNGIASSFSNIAVIYTYQGEYPRALEYSQKSLAIQEEIGNKMGIATSLNNVGFVYLKQGKYSPALDHCQRSLALREEIGAISSQKSTCICIYESYKAMGDGDKALEYLEKMRVIEDSLHTEETTKKLQQMEFAKQVYQDSVETFEKERQVQMAHEEEMRQEEKTRNWSITGGVFALLLAGGFYSRWRYVQKSRTTLQKAHDRSEKLLLNILPEEIAQELKEKGKADARDFENISILFTDFKGFTAASEKLSAQDLVAEINACFEAFDGIMGKYGIEKIKTIGDAYMAAGGLPVPSDDSVKNTILAALEMQDFIRDRKVELDALGKPGFEMRVGVHTGPVVAGIVGVKKFQYDIWGDTVNTASRMESSGEVGKVNVSQATYELLKTSTDFSFESRGKIEAKGKGEMEMLFVSLKNKIEGE